jgi:hypothetical protein
MRVSARFLAATPAILVATIASILGAGAAAAAYPDHPVRIIAPFAAGGPTDVVARILAQNLSESLKQQFFVENHVGAGGNLGMSLAARATPDGYTILVASSSYVVNPSLYANNPYDPYKDFIPITLAAASPNIVTVHPSVPVKTMKELIALILANPGKYAIANAGLGTTPQLASELFKLTYKLDAPSVPYGGGPPSVIIRRLRSAPFLPPRRRSRAATCAGSPSLRRSARPRSLTCRPQRRPASPTRNPKPCRVSSCRRERRKRSSSFCTTRLSK